MQKRLVSLTRNCCNNVAQLAGPSGEAVSAGFARSLSSTSRANSMIFCLFAVSRTAKKNAVELQAEHTIEGDILVFHRGPPLWTPSGAS
ncbi:hypothetical protein [Bradyrhizobium sp. NAS80.1]|uniref:hypothetical protein n=1 Tax=Bradyrhizobium sp. NAS80.1 TaxID=1680159 RepID=UPI00143D3E19|nr:hypothetical protein [Bradyrhizobium sp. NAS80.1]